MPFNKHLDTCERCRNEPFNLCPVGTLLMRSFAQEIKDEAARYDVKIVLPKEIHNAESTAE